ncbi:MAG: hypothetical protein JO321_07090 [Solirubrobacterales bacterium]|nr:hypothetical protein [Solirubrobacterales bacterium]MBV9535162.1 hypothetical protein [Solirubrobacterales bacterium]
MAGWRDHPIRTTAVSALMIVLSLLGVLVAIVLPVWAIPPFVIAWLLGCGALVERLFRTGPDE